MKYFIRTAIVTTVTLASLWIMPMADAAQSVPRPGFAHQPIPHPGFAHEPIVHPGSAHVNVPRPGSAHSKPRPGSAHSKPRPFGASKAAEHCRPGRLANGHDH